MVAGDTDVEVGVDSDVGMYAGGAAAIDADRYEYRRQH